MAANFFDRYMWLIDTIKKAGHITYEDLSRKWENSSLNTSGGPLAERTFFNHRQAILEQLGVEIKYEKPFGYCITNHDEVGSQGLRNWMLTSISVNSTLRESVSMRSRILCEEIPSGIKYLSPLIDAMKEGRSVILDYRPYATGYRNDNPVDGTEQDSGRKTEYRVASNAGDMSEVAPYCLKLFHQRWYLLGKVLGRRDGSRKGNNLKVFALDRIEDLKPGHGKFRLPEGFDAEEFFYGYFGVVMEGGQKPEIIKLKVWGRQCSYFRSLPLHPSQKEVETAPEWSVFTYYMAPTWDLAMELMQYGDMVEVLSPESLKNEIIDRAYSILEAYKEI